MRSLILSLLFLVTSLITIAQNGKIEGKISVAELLSLKATCTILGDIKTRRLAIEPGANFTGSCVMNNASAQGAVPPKRDEEKGK